MKLTVKTLLLLLTYCVLGCYNAFSQDENPVSWSAKYEKTEQAGVYEILLTASCEAGWHTYDLGPYNGGPNATLITVEPAQGVEAVGDAYVKKGGKKQYDDIFGMEIGLIENGDVLAQKVKISPEATVGQLNITVEWQACKEGACMTPESATVSVELPVNQTVTQSATTPQKATPVTQHKSLWALILEAIAWGFLALLTPCVFPMVPMTVSFFLKQNEKAPAKGRFMALFYGLSIMAIYTLPIAIIILITYIAGGGSVTASIFNWLATNWLPNVLFFIIFFIFALSFFGAFEITMPSKLVNSADSKSDKKGFLGIIFMALTLVLVSFSCTGPIVGTILIKSTQGEVWAPIVAMLAFSFAFALPFTIFAFAPALLKNLPKSGGWLNSVKVVLGFIELALGMKFLSVADQTYHWGLLDREVYLALWIVIFSLLGFYLLGKLRFKYDSLSDHVSIGRLILSIIVFAFVTYMIPGMWGAPLKALSGYLPPIQTQDFVVLHTSGDKGGDAATLNLGSVSASQKTNFDEPLNKPKYSNKLHLPYGLKGYFTFNEALKAAKAENKPIFLDFTGHGCVNCREMESKVWSDSRVQQILRNDYIICSLYGDDRMEAAESDWVTLPSGKVLKSLALINSHFMLEKFGANAQPFYILLDADGEPLADPMGYNLNVEEYIQFLQSGLSKAK